MRLLVFDDVSILVHFVNSFCKHARRKLVNALMPALDPGPEGAVLALRARSLSSEPAQ